MVTDKDQEDTLNFWRWSVATATFLALAAIAKFTKAPFAIPLPIKLLGDEKAAEADISLHMLFMVPVLAVVYALSLGAAIRLIDPQSPRISRLPLPLWDGIGTASILGKSLRTVFFLVYLILIPAALWGSVDWFFRADVFWRWPAPGTEALLFKGGFQNHLTHWQWMNLESHDYRYSAQSGVTFFPGWEPAIWLGVVGLAYGLLIRVYLYLIFGTAQPPPPPPVQVSPASEDVEGTG